MAQICNSSPYTEAIDKAWRWMELYEDFERIGRSGMTDEEWLGDLKSFKDIHNGTNGIVITIDPGIVAYINLENTFRTPDSTDQEWLCKLNTLCYEFRSHKWLKAYRDVKGYTGTVFDHIKSCNPTKAELISFIKYALNSPDDRTDYYTICSVIMHVVKMHDSNDSDGSHIINEINGYVEAAFARQCDGATPEAICEVHSQVEEMARVMRHIRVSAAMMDVISVM